MTPQTFADFARDLSRLRLRLLQEWHGVLCSVLRILRALHSPSSVCEDCTSGKIMER